MRDGYEDFLLRVYKPDRVGHIIRVEAFLDEIDLAVFESAGCFGFFLNTDE